MDQNYEKLFGYLNEVEPPQNLLSKIILSVQRQEKFLLKKRCAFLLVGWMGSAALLFWAAQSVADGFIESGFLKFFALIFSDFKIIAVYWQSYFLSLSEALPTASLIVFFVSFLIFINFLKPLAKNVKIVFASARLRII